MISLKPEGKNERKEKFFMEVSSGIQFLSRFYSLNQDRQQALLGLLMVLYAEQLEEDNK
jgi:hypothetical protein